MNRHCVYRHCHLSGMTKEWKTTSFFILYLALQVPLRYQYNYNREGVTELFGCTSSLGKSQRCFIGQSLYFASIHLAFNYGVQDRLVWRFKAQMQFCSKPETKRRSQQRMFCFSQKNIDECMTYNIHSIKPTLSTNPRVINGRSWVRLSIAKIEENIRFDNLRERFLLISK